VIKKVGVWQRMEVRVMGGLRGRGITGPAAVSRAAEGCRLRWIPRETVGYLCTIYM